jgi:hypothetical protein
MYVLIALFKHCTDKRCSLRPRPVLSRNRQPYLGPARTTQRQHPQVSICLHHPAGQQLAHARHGVHRNRYGRTTHDQTREACFPQSHPVLGLHRAFYTLHCDRQRMDKTAQHRPLRLDCSLRTVPYCIQPRSKRHHLHRKYIPTPQQPCNTVLKRPKDPRRDFPHSLPLHMPRHRRRLRQTRLLARSNLPGLRVQTHGRCGGSVQPREKPLWPGVADHERVYARGRGHDTLPSSRDAGS